MRKHELDTVQHLISRFHENANVVEVKQQGDILLIPDAHFHELAKGRTCVG